MRFTITPNFLWDPVNSEVLKGPYDAQTKEYPFGTLSWLMREPKILKTFVEWETSKGGGACWTVFYRNENGSVFWSANDGRSIVRAARIGKFAHCYRDKPELVDLFWGKKK